MIFNKGPFLMYIAINFRRHTITHLHMTLMMSQIKSFFSCCNILLLVIFNQHLLSFFSCTSSFISSLPPSSKSRSLLFHILCSYTRHVLESKLDHLCALKPIFLEIKLQVEDIKSYFKWLKDKSSKILKIFIFPRYGKIKVNKSSPL